MDEFLNTDNIDIMTMNSDEISFVDTATVIILEVEKIINLESYFICIYICIFENIPFFGRKKFKRI